MRSGLLLLVLSSLAIPQAAQSEPQPPPGLWLRQGCVDGQQLICDYQWQDGDTSGFPLMYKQVSSGSSRSAEAFEFLYRCTPKPKVVRITRASSLASVQRWTAPSACNSTAAAPLNPTSSPDPDRGWLPSCVGRRAVPPRSIGRALAPQPVATAAAVVAPAAARPARSILRLARAPGSVAGGRPRRRAPLER